MMFESRPSIRKFLWSTSSFERKQRLSVLMMPSISTAAEARGRDAFTQCRVGRQHAAKRLGIGARSCGGPMTHSSGLCLNLSCGIGAGEGGR